jgi:NADPH:quinone reductase
MKAIRIHKFGPSEDVLQYEEVLTPEPGAGELLIKVEAASLNRADLGLRKGTYRISPDALPVIPGREFAGTVAKVGAGVTEFKVGDRVVAYPSLGGYAEFATAKVAEVRPIPGGSNLYPGGGATNGISHGVVWVVGRWETQIGRMAAGASR